ncbi:hypothetical protein Y1Q_0008717 [Alligator mississippiensis]|uniref:Uncharacterized protein n=1 Tax=Alligator mississippiensis TaxID=8496 RepID=A0A151N9P6_ALLMI|nr:hypothetical protein Y1Q_0008717 [Alligator mississippiensis]
MQIAWQSLIGSGPNMKIDLAAYGGNIRVQKCIRVACDSPCYRITEAVGKSRVSLLRCGKRYLNSYKLFSMSL